MKAPVCSMAVGSDRQEYRQTPKKVDITYVRGDTLSFDFHVTWPQEEERQIVNGALFTVKGKGGEVLLQKSLTDGITPLDVQNAFRVRVAPQDTAQAVPGEYRHDLQLTLGEDDDVYTVMKGQFTLLDDVTEMRYE